MVMVLGGGGLDVVTINSVIKEYHQFKITSRNGLML